VTVHAHGTRCFEIHSHFGRQELTKLLSKPEVEKVGKKDAQLAALLIHADYVILT